MSKKRKLGKNNKSIVIKSCNDVCIFCNTSQEDELNLGKIKKCDDITVHYFCMLLSSGLVQNGKDEQGILGFLPKDINNEVLRGKRLKCIYCNRTGATIGCSMKKCVAKFHLPCGIKEGSLHQFYEGYASFCNKHKPIQKLTMNDRNRFITNNECPICQTTIEKLNVHSTLKAPCCKNSWFHRSCLQKQAINAALAFYRCPMCNDQNLFQAKMKKYGIYIPEQDASWEQEANAFEELYHRHNSCDVEDCECPDGRNFNVDDTKWEVILCQTCGSQGCHRFCGSLSWVKPEWECSICSSVGQQSDPKPTPKSSKRALDVTPHPTESKKIRIWNENIFSRSTDSSETSDTDTDIDVLNIDDDDDENQEATKKECCYSKNTDYPVIILSDSDDDDAMNSDEEEIHFAPHEEFFPKSTANMKNDVMNSPLHTSTGVSCITLDSDHESSTVCSEVDPSEVNPGCDLEDESDSKRSDSFQRTFPWTENEMEKVSGMWKLGRHYEVLTPSGGSKVKIVVKVVDDEASSSDGD